MINNRTFALAGKATFTVTSLRTQQRFTFRVTQREATQPHFVQVLTGPDNEASYSYLGTIFADGNYRHGKKSKINPAAPAALAFNYVWNHIENLDPTKVEFHHAGKCCRCGRTLTVPRSIELGCGPECAEQLGVAF